MEGTSSWKPNDWRTQHEPDLRKKVILAIVGKLKICFPGRTDGINQSAITFEEKIYRMAKDKGDYLRKINERIVASEKRFRSGGTSANGAHNPDPAHPTGQQWLPQNNIQSNLNIPNSSGMLTQAPVTFSVGQTPQHQQQHQQQQSLLKQPIQQQLPHHTSLSPIKQSFPQSSSLCLPSSGQQNSQFLLRHQIPTQQQEVHSSHRQQMAVVPSHEHKKLQREQLISQLVNGQDTQKTHITSPQNKREQQQIYRVSTSQASLLSTQSQEVEKSQPLMPQQYQPSYPVQQQSHNRILPQHLDDTQRFQAAGYLHQSQNLAGQQNQPYQLQRAHQANPSTSQDSTGMMVNTSGDDWREETYQKIKALREKHILYLSTVFRRLSDRLQEIDSLPQQKMLYERGKNIRAALEQILVFLNVSRSSVSEFHRDRFSVYETQILKFIKSQRERQQQQPPSQIHQTALQSLDSDQMPHSSQTRPKVDPKDDNNIMSSSGNFAVHSLEQNMQLLQRQQQQKEQQTKQQKQLQIPENDVRMRQTVNSKAEMLQQHLSSSQCHLPKPSASPARMSPLASSPQMQKYSSPQLVEQQTLPTPLNKTKSQEPPLVTLQPEPVSERPIDRLIKAIQSSSPESLAQSVSEMSSVISMSDRFAGSVHSTRGYRARVAEDLSDRTRLHLQQGDTKPTKRFKRSFTTTPRDITSQTESYKQFSVNKNEPSYALLQEIIEINGRLVETVVNICNGDVCPSEVTSGTVVVTCSYVPVALSATFKALYNSGHIPRIQPLRLLVPDNYPSSPIILEKTLFDTASAHRYQDLSARARSRFGFSMREYSEAMSLKEIAKVWDECARATMVEYAERHGGGSFSSKYGRWESVLRAS